MGGGGGNGWVSNWWRDERGKGYADKKARATPHGTLGWTWPENVSATAMDRKV